MKLVMATPEEYQFDDEVAGLDQAASRPSSI